MQRVVLAERMEDLQDYLALAVVSPAGTAYYYDGTTAELGDREYVQKLLPERQPYRKSYAAVSQTTR